MKEKIKNLILILKNKKTINIDLTYLAIFIFFLVFSSFIDAFTTILVVLAGGNELNPFMQDLLDKGIFTFFYSKIIIFPIFFLFITIILSDLVFYIFKNDKSADNFIIYSVLIYSIVGFGAGIFNFINYLIL